MSQQNPPLTRRKKLSRKPSSMTEPKFGVCYHGCLESIADVYADLYELSTHYTVCENVNNPDKGKPKGQRSRKPGDKWVTYDEVKAQFGEKLSRRKINTLEIIREDKRQHDTRKKSSPQAKNSTSTSSVVVAKTNQRTQKPAPVTPSSLRPPSQSTQRPTQDSEPTPEPSPLQRQMPTESQDEPLESHIRAAEEQDIRMNESNGETPLTDDQSPGNDNELLGLPNELLSQIIQQSLERPNGPFWQTSIPPRYDAHLETMKTNKVLRLETLHYLATQRLVVKLTVHYHDLPAMASVEQALSEVSFFQLPDELDHKTSLQKPIVSLDVSLHVRRNALMASNGVHTLGYNNPTTGAYIEPATERLRSRTTRIFLFEMHSFRMFTHIIQQMNCTGALGKLSLLFGNRNMNKVQEKATDSVLEITGLLRGPANVEIIGAPIKHNIPALLNSIQSPMRLFIDQRILYLNMLLSRAASLFDAGRPVEALFEVFMARATISPSLLGEVHGELAPEWRGVVKHSRQLARLAESKITLAMCQKVYPNGLISEFVSDQNQHGLIGNISLRFGPVFQMAAQPEEFRAQVHAVLASGEIFHHNIMFHLGAEMRYEHSHFTKQAEQDIVVAVASGYNEPHLLTLADQLAQIPEPSSPAKALNITPATEIYGCITEPGLVGDTEEGMKWECLESRYERENNGRVPTWYGLQSQAAHSLNILEPLQPWTERAPASVSESVAKAYTDVMAIKLCLPEEVFVPEQGDDSKDHDHESEANDGQEIGDNEDDTLMKQWRPRLRLEFVTDVSDLESAVGDSTESDSSEDDDDESDDDDEDDEDNGDDDGADDGADDMDEDMEN